MKKHNAENERIKRRYFSYLKEANRYSEPTVDAVAKALARFESDTKFRDFKKFHPEQAIAFKRRLSDQINQRTGKKLSKATIHSTLAHLKRFFHWLAGQPGYRSRLQYSDADYFNLSEKEVRVASAKREQSGPTLDQVEHVISVMPANSVIERRNRALIAFTLLTGARDSAIASIKLKHIDLVSGCVVQDAREVQTKFSKTFTTFFFPVAEGIKQLVEDWVAFLRIELLWGENDPLFPATRVVLGDSHRFEAVGIERIHWKTATSIRTIFRDAFERAGLPYYNPHSFRNTLVRLGQSICQTPEEFKAWSQNLGHEKVLTTFLSYGEVECSRQGELIRSIGTIEGASNPDVSDLAKAIVREIRESKTDTPEGRLI